MPHLFVLLGGLVLIAAAVVMWVVQGRDGGLSSWVDRMVFGAVGVGGLLVCVWCFLPHA